MVGLTSGVATVSATGSLTCAVTTAGGVKCWGWNRDGQLGDGTTTDRSTPVDVVSLTSGVAAVSVTDLHTCVLTTAGGIKCWGRNNFGQLGDGTRRSSRTPVNVVDLTGGVTAISAGDNYTCAVTTASALKCWGLNDVGQLGDGTIRTRTKPVDVPPTASVIVMAEATAVSAELNHTCALTTASGVRCWGFTAFYSDRLGETSYGSATPVGVTGLTGEVATLSAGSGTLNALSASVIGSVAPPFAGGPSCVVTAEGGVKCWDWLGDGTRDSARPVDVAGLTSGVATVSVSVGGGRICAVTTAGGLKCWELSGEVGDETTADRSPPVDVAGLTSGVATVSLGRGHTCAVTTAGGVKCLGSNEFGQLGDGTTADITTPLDVVGLKSGVASVSAGRRHTCAVTTEGGLKCWGNNFSGQLGDGTTRDRTTPVDVVGLTSGMATVSAGSSHTCAVTTEGVVKYWGSNELGQLGDGTTTDRATPVDVVGLTSGVATVSAGSSHTCAVTTVGGVKCWGNGFSGRLGDGTTKVFSSTPVDVIGFVSEWWLESS